MWDSSSQKKITSATLGLEAKTDVLIKSIGLENFFRIFFIEKAINIFDNFLYLSFKWCQNFLKIVY